MSDLIGNPNCWFSHAKANCNHGLPDPKKKGIDCSSSKSLLKALKCRNIPVVKTQLISLTACIVQIMDSLPALKGTMPR